MLWLMNKRQDSCISKNTAVAALVLLLHTTQRQFWVPVALNVHHLVCCPKFESGAFVTHLNKHRQPV
jgi:hypothetical protein